MAVDEVLWHISALALVGYGSKYIPVPTRRAHQPQTRTPLYTLCCDRLELEGRALDELLRAWRMFGVSGLSVKTFDGRPVTYNGIKFDGSPRHVFWSGFFEPFLNDISKKCIEWILSECRQRDLPPSTYVAEMKGLLVSLIMQTFNNMAETEQLLLGNGSPFSIPRRDVSTLLDSTTSRLDDVVKAMTHRGDAAFHPDERKIDVSQPDKGVTTKPLNGMREASTEPAVHRLVVAVAYAWEEESELQQWVTDHLVARLRREHGIDAYCDKTRLPGGGNLATFMEGMVKADRILVVCTPAYVNKLGTEKGGVSYEAQQLRALLFADNQTTKVVPVIRKGARINEVIPSFLPLRRGFDLRGELGSDAYESEFRTLVADLLGQTQEVPLGNASDRASPTGTEIVRPSSNLNTIRENIRRLDQAGDIGALVNLLDHIRTANTQAAPDETTQATIPLRTMAFRAVETIRAPLAAALACLESNSPETQRRATVNLAVGIGFPGQRARCGLTEQARLCAAANILGAMALRLGRTRHLADTLAGRCPTGELLEREEYAHFHMPALGFDQNECRSWLLDEISNSSVVRHCMVDQENWRCALAAYHITLHLREYVRCVVQNENRDRLVALHQKTQQDLIVIREQDYVWNPRTMFGVVFEKRKTIDRAMEILSDCRTGLGDLLAVDDVGRGVLARCWPGWLVQVSLRWPGGMPFRLRGEPMEEVLERVLQLI